MEENKIPLSVEMMNLKIQNHQLRATLDLVFHHLTPRKKELLRHAVKMAKTAQPPFHQTTVMNIFKNHPQLGGDVGNWATLWYGTRDIKMSAMPALIYEQFGVKVSFEEVQTFLNSQLLHRALLQCKGMIYF